MTMLADHLSEDELRITNAIVQNIVHQCASLSPERMAFIATQAAAQVTGVVMARGSHPVRGLDAQRLNEQTDAHFRQGKARTHIHAMDETVNGMPVRQAIAKLFDCAGDLEL